MTIKKAVLILAVLLILILAIFTIFYAYQKQKLLEEKSQVINQQVEDEPDLSDDKRQQILNILEELDEKRTEQSMSHEEMLTTLGNLDQQIGNTTETKENILQKLEELDK